MFGRRRASCMSSIRFAFMAMIFFCPHTDALSVSMASSSASRLVRGPDAMGSSSRSLATFSPLLHQGRGYASKHRRGSTHLHHQYQDIHDINSPCRCFRHWRRRPYLGMIFSSSARGTGRKFARKSSLFTSASSSSEAKDRPGDGTAKRGGAQGSLGSVEDRGEGIIRGGGGEDTSGSSDARGTTVGPPSWAPHWALQMHPVVQLGASVGLYFLHMLFLSKGGITFPIQIVPNSYGLTQSMGLDTAAGFGVIGLAAWSRVRSGLPLLPPLRDEGMPWRMDGNRVRKKLPLTFAVLVIAYLLSGLGAHVCEYMLYFLSLAGINMSVAMHRSVQVLVSHLIWVVMGVRILGLALKSFFNREKGSWVGMKWKSNWLWWVVGGYFASSSLFNMADLANQFICPLPPDTESVVVKIINPENNDISAMAVGSIAPCISAPWWEEVLYRGFLLPALTCYLPLKAAVPTGAILFAVHHMNLQAMLPLSMLGLVWSLLFMYSGNLLVTVLIHAMWNSRVFLGSLLGL